MRINLSLFSKFSNISKLCALRFFNHHGHSRNPYEILGLKKTCSNQDVKKAYIKLCKELHPDMKPGDLSQHKKFIELNNAYTTLINKQYEKSGRERMSNYTKNNFYWKSQAQSDGPFDQSNWQRNSWYEHPQYREYFYQHKSKCTRQRMQHVSNLWIIFGCFLLLVGGSISYLSAYSYARKYSLQKVDEKSRRISEDYNYTRKHALKLGSAEKVEQLRRRWSL